MAEQRIGFATARDGVRIAYAASGRGPVLLIAPHWFSHLELEWDSPVRRHWLTALSARYTVIRYDLRGTGLSDRGVDAQSLEVWLDDLAAVLDTAAVEQCALLGVCQAGPIAVAFAARQPGGPSPRLVWHLCPVRAARHQAGHRSGRSRHDGTA